ncbi:5-(carboxyamino)imidazole ribonucleotide synthase [Ilumatobacter sp.]|uniref:5-(carboxyamino)imidazole ribonucleotide synthase n=1 Tax=Ilumatobacter sp. TaxID=1967498 RepID=UPI003C5134D8
MTDPTRPDEPIVPPATIGMLGGGQLGKYALSAANAMGYRTLVVDPDPDAPAAVVTNEHVVTSYDDPDALDRLASKCSVVTTEFENAPASALESLSMRTRVAPSAHAVAIAQDRLVEKAFMVAHGIAVGPHAPAPANIGDEQRRAAHALAHDGAVIKTARLGYDGKGQRRVTGVEELDAVLAEFADTDCIVESLLDLRCEVSVIIARTADGASTHWDVAENIHVDGILDVSIVPARIDPTLAARAVDLATSIVEGLDYVGVLTVEMFVVDDDRLLVNEVAPRPHNSGHWTLDASVTSQFEQQIRAVCNVGLGATDMTAPAVAMVNLLGDLWFPDGAVTAVEPDWSVALADPAATLHLYGKTEPRPARKMGHLTVTAPTADAAEHRALELRALVTR